MGISEAEIDSFLASKRPPHHPQTAAGTRTLVRFLPREATLATALTRRTAELRNEVALLGEDVGRTHRAAQFQELALRSEAKARLNPGQLLNYLTSDRGMSWTSLARMIHVSVPAITKWRKGDSPSPDNRRRLSVLAAFIEMLEDHFEIADPVSWMEMPFWEGVPLSPVEVYSERGYDLLLEYAAGHIEGGALLDAFLPSWRETYPPSEFEVFTAPDGELAIRRRSSEQ